MSSACLPSRRLCHSRHFAKMGVALHCFLLASQPDALADFVIPSTSRVDTGSPPRPVFDYAHRTFVRMQTKPKLIADDVAPIDMTFFVDYRSEKMWRVDYFNFLQVDYHIDASSGVHDRNETTDGDKDLPVGPREGAFGASATLEGAAGMRGTTEEGAGADKVVGVHTASPGPAPTAAPRRKNFKYLFKNGARACITEDEIEAASDTGSTWTNLKLFPDLTNYTYTGDVVVRGVLAREWTSSVPAAELAADKGGYLKFYSSIGQPAAPVRWLAFRARNPAFDAHTDVWTMDYLLFEPAVDPDSNLDIQAQLKIFELPRECVEHPIVFPDMSLTRGAGGGRGKDEKADKTGVAYFRGHDSYERSSRHGLRHDPVVRLAQLLLQHRAGSPARGRLNVEGPNDERASAERVYLARHPRVAAQLEALGVEVDARRVENLGERERWAELAEEVLQKIDATAAASALKMGLSDDEVPLFPGSKLAAYVPRGKQQKFSSAAAQRPSAASLREFVRSGSNAELLRENQAQNPREEGEEAVVPLAEAAQEDELRLQQPTSTVEGPQDNSPSLPTFLDLRFLLGAVKDQGICGSCWSFAFIAAVEGALAKNFGRAHQLSEQFILDCAWGAGSHACDGGNAGADADVLFTAIPQTRHYGGYLSVAGRCHRPITGDQRQLHLLQGEQQEQEPGGEGERGTTSSGPRVVAWVLVEPRADVIKRALYEKGVLAVVLLAVPEVLYYGGGVIDTDRCANVRPEETDHAVALVGYNDESGSGSGGGGRSTNVAGLSPPSWTLRNSWSTAWGELGYFRVSQAKDCGVGQAPAYPKLAMQ